MPQEVERVKESSAGDISGLLTELQELAPKAATMRTTAVIYTSVAPDEIIDESGSGDAEFLQPDEETDITEPDSSEEVEHDTGTDFLWEDRAPQSVPEFRHFTQGSAVPICAVDCGLIQLGVTVGGIVIALRATITLKDHGETSLHLFRTGPVYLRNDHKVEVMQSVGAQLGAPNFYVRKRKDSAPDSTEMELKGGVDFDAHSYADRLRNWLERKVQRIAVESINDGVVLLDGALTLRTRDTPSAFLQHIAKRANEKGNAVVGISKQSILEVCGKSIRFWLEDTPRVAGYRCLTPLMLKEGAQRVLGNTYASRFSALGPTLRMDVKAARGQSDEEALALLYGNTLMRGGYPDILVRAHVHSYFTSPHVTLLKVQAAVTYGLVPYPEVSFAAAFGLFAGRYKQ